ncbi:hypothetical protein [Shewanella woodyi]|uniref:hypothetical protein n=1 Tax=Shewanella woodyi TaxID=60961 RepID=UPI0037484459
MKYSIGDLVYQGETAGVHNWNTISGTSFYWHPDWLHIAEEATGVTPTAQITLPNNQISQTDAEQTIINHLNSKS